MVVMEVTDMATEVMVDMEVMEVVMGVMGVGTVDMEVSADTDAVDMEDTVVTADTVMDTKYS